MCDIHDIKYVIFIKSVILVLGNVSGGHDNGGESGGS